ncbi:hypothetical protein Tco_1015009, partial [Tanacetum coccineum]
EDDNVSSNVRSPLLLMHHQSCHLHHSDLDIDQLSVQNVPADDHGVIGTVSTSEGPRRQCFSQNSGGQTSSQVYPIDGSFVGLEKGRYGVSKDVDTGY